MDNLQLYYATNRRHIGNDRWNPERYGTDFSTDGLENLRFGRVELEVDPKELSRFIKARLRHGSGDGEGLANYLGNVAGDRRKIAVQAFEEHLEPTLSDVNQPATAVWGSAEMFDELREAMLVSTDVLAFVHGFNVNWEQAVGTALALQAMLNTDTGKTHSRTLVVLFTWPSDGLALPWVSYKSDRADALASGGALGRGILKFRDYLARLRREQKEACNRKVHLLCHSMGAYALECAVAKMQQFSNSRTMPRLFENVFLCAADSDDTALESAQPLGRLHELTRLVTVYHNRYDQALAISESTKGNPDRLGSLGLARPTLVHHKIEQVDCSESAPGPIGHSYYLSGCAIQDIRESLLGTRLSAPSQYRVSGASPNTWVLRARKRR
ncbi:MAG: alpha/beta hydrolase [Planctomycetes bacterium]|nr:alpha/beta hydrolase [Planctomycetota bacterium]MCW8134408.1 alpha/beta hydrolase [Planctomycetota bacterium]